MTRRQSDKPRWMQTLFGIIILAFAIVIRVLHLVGEDWFILVLVALGAGMVRPEFIKDLFTIWQRRNGGASGPSNPPKSTRLP